jgi:pimeloyl-ACP methyl ester carboxylesterase
MSIYGNNAIPGQLFLYAAGRAAFESPVNRRAGKKCILLGGLSDGLLPVPYTNSLYQQAIEPNDDWSLVQPILSSSYTCFGHGSLQRDTEELDELFSFLLEHGGAEQFGLVGHSTGCQNAVHYMKCGKYRDILKVVALQAPVSDREHAMQEEGYEQNIQVATQMREDGRANEMMPRSAFWAPITASRFLDLQHVGGADDFFSSDFSDEQLIERLEHIGDSPDRRVLVAFSGSDEYVPDTVGDRKSLMERLVNAMNIHCPSEQLVAKGLYLPKANHNLSQAPGDSDLFVKALVDLFC